MSASISDAQVATLKVAILGFGTVGTSVARILCDARLQGVELTHIFNRSVARKRVDWVPSKTFATLKLLTSGRELHIEKTCCPDVSTLK